MSGKKDKGKKYKLTSAFETFPLAQAEKADPEDGATTPPVKGVADAKHWVDENKK